MSEAFSIGFDTKLITSEDMMPHLIKKKQKKNNLHQKQKCFKITTILNTTIKKKNIKNR